MVTEEATERKRLAAEAGAKKEIAAAEGALKKRDAEIGRAAKKATAAFNRPSLTRQLRRGGGVDTLQPHKKDDFVEAAKTMTVPLEADGEGGFGAGGPDGVCSEGRATARPPSLWVHRDTTTTPPSSVPRSRRHYRPPPK